MKDSIHRITEPGHKPISLAKAREIMEHLRRLAKEANIAVVIPRQVHPPARVEFPVNVDMVFGLYSPKADDSDAQIEMYVLKSRKPKREPYTTIQTESSFCPECDKPVVLLSTANEGPTEDPMFYFCWDCKFLAEIGVGRVEEFVEPPEEEEEELPKRPESWDLMRCREATEAGREEVTLVVPHISGASVTHYSALDPRSPAGLVLGQPAVGGTSVRFNSFEMLEWLTKKKVPCPDCNGTGHYPGSVTPYCATCDGTGWIDE